MNSKSTINHLDTIDPLMRALTALLRPTAEAMREGGIANLSIAGASKFVLQLENGHVIEGEIEGRESATLNPIKSHE